MLILLKLILAEEAPPATSSASLFCIESTDDRHTYQHAYFPLLYPMVLLNALAIANRAYKNVVSDCRIMQRYRVTRDLQHSFNQNYSPIFHYSNQLCHNTPAAASVFLQTEPPAFFFSQWCSAISLKTTYVFNYVSSIFTDSPANFFQLHQIKKYIFVANYHSSNPQSWATLAMQQ